MLLKILILNTLIYNVNSYCTPSCDFDNNQCGGWCDLDDTCKEGVSCHGRTNVCYYGHCVECSADSHCMDMFSPYPQKPRVCDIEHKMCVECNSDSDCKHSIKRKMCDYNHYNGNTCVECTDYKECESDSNCGGDCFDGECTIGFNCTSQNKYCSLPLPPTNSVMCVECNSDSQCSSPQRPKCSTLDNKCHECTRDHQCRSNIDCSATCVQLNGTFVCIEGNPPVNCSTETPCDLMDGQCKTISINSSAKILFNFYLLFLLNLGGSFPL